MGLRSFLFYRRPASRGKPNEPTGEGSSHVTELGRQRPRPEGERKPSGKPLAFDYNLLLPAPSLDRIPQEEPSMLSAEASRALHLRND